MKQYIRAVALTAAISSAVLSTAAAANAELWVHVDARGDVVKGSESSEDIVPAPGRVEGDIRRVSVDHRADAVVLTTRYVALRRLSHVFLYEIRTDEGLGRSAWIESDRSNPKGTISFTKLSGATVQCTGLRHTIDYAAGSVRLVVPRTCLSAPRWVRVGSGTLTFGASALFADDGLSEGVGDEITLGPRVRRG